MFLDGFKGVIFDLDGTLLDSMSVWQQVDIDFLAKRGIAVPEDYQDAVKNMYFSTAAVYTKERFSLSDTVEEIMAEWVQLGFEAYKNRVRLKAGAKRLLNYLYENNVKLAFATANEEQLSEAVLTSNGVWELFSANAYVAETGKDKSEPEVYLLACKRLGVKPSECVVFEDILQGIEGAKKGGFTVCGVFDESSKEDWDKIVKTADFSVLSFEELF